MPCGAPARSAASRRSVWAAATAWRSRSRFLPPKGGSHETVFPVVSAFRRDFDRPLSLHSLQTTVIILLVRDSRGPNPTIQTMKNARFSGTRALLCRVTVLLTLVGLPVAAGRTVEAS